MLNDFLLIILILIALVSSSAIPINASLPFQAKSLATEDLLSRHINSIGSPDALSFVTTRLAGGTFRKVDVLGWYGGSLEGDAVITSSGPKFYLSLKSNAKDSLADQLVFDGTDASTGTIRKGRSYISEFFNRHPAPLKDGLIAGVLSTAWPFLIRENITSVAKYVYPKKVDGQQVFALDYRPSKEYSQLQVRLYFDAKTFCHVRTEYKGRMVGYKAHTNETNLISEGAMTLTEHFSEFREVDGLTLPHNYKLRVSAEIEQRSLITEWKLKIDWVKHNQHIDMNSFRIR